MSEQDLGWVSQDESRLCGDGDGDTKAREHYNSLTGEQIEYYHSDDDMEQRERIRKKIVGDDADSDMEMPGIRYLSILSMYDGLHINPWNGRRGYPRNDTAPMLEIFSVSFHAKIMDGNIRYHLYGNIFIEDRNGYYQKVMQRSSKDSIIVSNGDTIPLLGIIRSCCSDPSCSISMCLKGHELDSYCGDCGAYSEVLIKNEKIVHTVHRFRQEDSVPSEILLSGVDKFYYAKVHYAASWRTFLVEVEVKLCSLKDDEPGMSEYEREQVCIEGRLNVHWKEFEDYQDLNYYKIILFDTKWGKLLSSSPSSSSSFNDCNIRVNLGEPIPLWRTKLLVPCGYTLVFGADFQTDVGDKFSENMQVLVDAKSREFTCELDSCSHCMQLNLIHLTVF